MNEKWNNRDLKIKEESSKECEAETEEKTTRVVTLLFNNQRPKPLQRSSLNTGTKEGLKNND